MTKPIIARYFFAICLKLDSPLSVSSGDDVETDSDVIRNGEGNPFIPGTSVAGAIRDYIKQKKDEPGFMGFSRKNDGRMSSIFISDLEFSGRTVVSERDEVKLKDDKTAEYAGKFNLEIIETGAETVLYSECVEREGDKYNFADEIKDVAGAINSGDIRFGQKKNRGLGWMKVTALYQKRFTATDIDDFLDFYPDWKERILDDKYKLSCDLTRDEDRKNRLITMQIPLKQKGCISIRTYSANAGEPDFSHITCNDKPVIPGSSMNGALRARAKEIMLELGVQKAAAEKLLGLWFGHVSSENNSSQSLQSRVIFNECIIEGASRTRMTRNRIDPVTQATVGTALYSEVSYANGSTNMIVKIRKDKDNSESDRALIGLIMLLFDEIKEGYISVGGETGIGHGIFKAAYDTSDDYGSGMNRGECMKSLYTYLRQEVRDDNK